MSSGYGETRESFVVNHQKVDQFGYRVRLKKRTNDSVAEFGFTSYVQRFQLFESLFSKFMYCEGTIFDGGGLVERIGIQAGDILDISIFKSEQDEKKDMVTNEFYIESVNAGDRSPSTKAMTYSFRAVSKVGFRAITHKLKRSYTKSGSEIVKDICRDFFQLGEDLYPAEHFQDTFGTIAVGATVWSPFQLIDYISMHSITSENKAFDNNYFFWETREGVYYKSIRKIVKDGSTLKYIIPVDKNRDQQSQAADFFRVQDYQIKTTNDQRKKLLEGALENKTMSFDFVHRKVEEKEFKLKDSYRDIFLMGNNIAIDKQEIDNMVGDDNRRTDEKQSLFVRCSNKSYDQKIDFLVEKRGPSKAQHQMLNQMVVSLQILGNPKLKPGDTIDLTAAMPQDGKTEEADLFLSGKFIVGSCKHVVVDLAEYITIVDLFKDGYERDFSDFRKDQNSHLTSPKPAA